MYPLRFSKQHLRLFFFFAVKKFQADKAKKEKKKKFVRTAAGQTWEDTTLEEWDQGMYI